MNGLGNVRPWANLEVDGLEFGDNKNVDLGFNWCGCGFLDN